MTRLDLALVKKKRISSRARAQRAIRLGLVTVNGQVIYKPSFQVRPDDEVVVDVMADKPSGYWKLKLIQNDCPFIQAGDTVLDVGASAGGFMLYTLELASKVYALEFSPSLIPELELIASQYPRKAIVLHADAFVYDFHRFTGYFDVILNDVTAEPETSLKLLARCALALKVGGRVLQVLKGKVSEATADAFKKSIENIGFNILCLLKSEKDELFIIGEKKADLNAEEGI